MGMQILEQINAGIESADEPLKMRIMVWNGIIFNCMLYWNQEGYQTPLEELTSRMTEITETLFDEGIAEKYRL